MREIDVYFTPNANLSATSDLGLLAQCAANSAAFEPFRNPVAALPADSPYRANTLELFSNLRVILEAKQNVEPEERELIMQLSPLLFRKN